MIGDSPGSTRFDIGEKKLSLATSGMPPFSTAARSISLVDFEGAGMP
jgi:hypothetical protein